MDVNKILKKLQGGDRYDKACTYLKQGRIKDPIIDGNTIIAEVVGSDVYRVKIFLDKDDVKCTCPDYAEYCKHVIAVMLAYKNNKKLFSENNKIFDDLKNKSKEELINIIKQMHINKIDLMSLFKTKDSKIKQIKDFSKDLYDVEDLFEEGYMRYNEVPGLLKKLDSLYTLALDYKEKEDFGKKCLRKLQKIKEGLDVSQMTHKEFINIIRHSSFCHPFTRKFDECGVCKKFGINNRYWIRNWDGWNLGDKKNRVGQ